MISAEKLYKSFDGTPVLTGLDLRVQKGSIYGLIGVNGAGKTTVINLLAGIYRPDSGNITIDGKAVYDKKDIKCRTGLISDTIWFPAGATLEKQAALRSRLYPSWDHAKYSAVTEALHLETKKNLRSFSKGMKKQAAFALTLAAQPDVLLLDEPMDGLDPIVRKVIRNLIIDETADRGMTVLISSHNLRDLENICDTVGILSGGHMHAEQMLEDMRHNLCKVQLAFADPRSSEKLSALLNVLHKERLGSLEYWIIREPQQKIQEIISRENPKIFDILPMTLEEIFLYEVGGDRNEYKEILF